MARLAKRAYLPGDPLPAVGDTCLVSGSNQDIESDQDRSYSERRVIGYTPCGLFACFQTRDCWPTVEKLTNCWFAAKPATVPELHRALDEARRSLSELMRHSCIADSAPEDKDGDDHSAESRAMGVIRLLDTVIDPSHLQPTT